MKAIIEKKTEVFPNSVTLYGTVFDTKMTCYVFGIPIYHSCKTYIITAV